MRFIENITLTKKSFLILSFTWGILLTLMGFVLAAVMLVTGHRPHRFGWCWYFEVGKKWGGCELGLFFLKCRNGGRFLMEHEFGHAIQNCFFGPFMPVFVSAPSSLRFWFRKLASVFGYSPKKDYYSVWFERQASTLGHRYMVSILETSLEICDRGAENVMTE